MYTAVSPSFFVFCSLPRQTTTPNISDGLHHPPGRLKTQATTFIPSLPCLNLAFNTAGSVSSKYQLPSGRANAPPAQRKVMLSPVNASVSVTSISRTLPQSVTGSRCAAVRMRSFCLPIPSCRPQPPPHRPTACTGHGRPWACFSGRMFSESGQSPCSSAHAANARRAAF